MNTFIRNAHVIAIATSFAALAAFAGSARAEDATYELPQPAVSTKTRAEVRAELLQARAAGTLLATEADFQKQPVFASTKSRAEVQSEVRAAAASGELDAQTGEPQGFAAPRIALRRAATPVITAARR